jgi:hypothetical protein
LTLLLFADYRGRVSVAFSLVQAYLKVLMVDGKRDVKVATTLSLFFNRKIQTR